MKKSHSRSHKQLLGALAAVSNLGASAFKRARDAREGGLRLKIPKNATKEQLRAAQLAIILAERARGASDSSLSSEDRAGIEKVVSAFVAGKAGDFSPTDSASKFDIKSSGDQLVIADLLIGERTGANNGYVYLCPHQIRRITKKADGADLEASTLDAARGRYAARVMYHMLGTGLSTRAIDNVNSIVAGDGNNRKHYLFLGPEGSGSESRMKLDRNICYNIRLSKKQIEEADQNRVYLALSRRNDALEADIDNLIQRDDYGGFQNTRGARARSPLEGLAGSELSEHLGAMRRRRRKSAKSSSKRRVRKSARRVSRRKRK